MIHSGRSFRPQQLATSDSLDARWKSRSSSATKTRELCRNGYVYSIFNNQDHETIMFAQYTCISWYRDRGRWRKLDVRSATIRLRGQCGGSSRLPKRYCKGYTNHVLPINWIPLWNNHLWIDKSHQGFFKSDLISWQLSSTFIACNECPSCRFMYFVIDMNIISSPSI